MEPRRPSLLPKRKLKKDSAVQVARWTEAIEERFQSIGRVQGFLEEKGPSHEKELEQLLSGRQVQLVREAFGGLADFLTGNQGFYQADEGNYTFVYYLGPEFEWLAPSPPAKIEEGSSCRTAPLPSSEDIPRDEKDGLGEEDVAAVGMAQMVSIWSICASPCDTDSGSYVTALDETEEPEKKVQGKEEEKKEEGQNRWDVEARTARPYWEWRDMCETETQSDADFESQEQPAASSEPSEEFGPSRPMGVPHSDRIAHRSWEPRGGENPWGGRRNRFVSSLLPMPRVNADPESCNSRCRPVAPHRQRNVEFRRNQGRLVGSAVSGAVNVAVNPVGGAVVTTGSDVADNTAGKAVGGALGGAVGVDPLDLHDRSEPGARRQAEDQRHADDKENIPRQLPGGGAASRVQRHWHGRLFWNQHNQTETEELWRSPGGAAP